MTTKKKKKPQITSLLTWELYKIFYTWNGAPLINCETNLTTIQQSHFTDTTNIYMHFKSLVVEVLLLRRTWTAQVISRAVKMELHGMLPWWWQMKGCYHKLESTHPPETNMLHFISTTKFQWLNSICTQFL